MFAGFWATVFATCHLEEGGSGRWYKQKIKSLVMHTVILLSFPTGLMFIYMYFLDCFCNQVLIVPPLDINHTLHLALKQRLISWSNWCANEVREGQDEVCRCVTSRIRLFCCCAMLKYWSKLNNALPGTNEMTLVENWFYHSVSSDYQIFSCSLLVFCCQNSFPVFGLSL